MTAMNRTAFRLVVCALALVAPRAGAEDGKAGAPGAPAQAPVSGITAIGDVHGDFKTFHALLVRAGLIDREGRWTGGKRHLVQTGDLLDRGPASRQILELLMRLEGEAEAEGGRVTVLLGNHEVMNVVGDLRYVTAEEFTAFARDEDRGERARRQVSILSLARTGSPLLKSSYYRELHRFLDLATLDRVFPPGFFGHRAAFSPAGRYGRWLLGKDTVLLAGKSIFLHGGLSPRYASLEVEEINRQVKEAILQYFTLIADLERRAVFDGMLGYSELLLLLEAEKRAGGPQPDLKETFRQLGGLLNGILFAEDGPLWYRGLAQLDESLIEADVDRILRFHGADRIVMGHTQPVSLAIEARLGGRVILIDTGMNQAVYLGNPAALVLPPEGGFRVIDLKPRIGNR